MHVGLYFGSFNPIHIGHLIIANFVAYNTTVEQVWLVVSPQNPLKHSNSLLNEYHRLHLANRAIDNNPKLKVVDVEFKLPRPSYTVDTLAYLSEKYPQHSFSVIMGSDSFQNLKKWKNSEIIARDYNLIVYKRPGYEIENSENSSVQFLQAPLLDISASVIRQMIRDRKSIQYLVPDQARTEIEDNNYYR